MSLFELKRGYGQHTIATAKGRQILRAGDRVECHVDLLGNAIDKFAIITPGADLEPVTLKTTTSLRIVHKGHGKYDVVHPATGVPINTAPLTKTEASELVEERAAEGPDENDNSATGKADQASPKDGKPAGDDDSPEGDAPARTDAGDRTDANKTDDADNPAGDKQATRDGAPGEGGTGSDTGREGDDTK